MTVQATLLKIGNFVGLKIREIMDALSLKADKKDLNAALDLISTKAGRPEVEALPRFFEATSSSSMLNLDGVRTGDFCLRSDAGNGFRLRRLPSSDPASWEQVFASASASVTKTVSFPRTLSPVIYHGMGKLPVSASFSDDSGRVHYTEWELVDYNSIRAKFTEEVGGRCSMTFSS